MNRLCRKRPPYITIRMPIRLVKDPKIDKENSGEILLLGISPLWCSLPFDLIYFFHFAFH